MTAVGVVLGCGWCWGVDGAWLGPFVFGKGGRLGRDVEIEGDEDNSMETLFGNWNKRKREWVL